jgi:hypothetical protein
MQTVAGPFGQIDDSIIHAIADLPMGRVETGCRIDRHKRGKIAAEQKWYALTGRVVEARVKADGDIHLELQDANGNKAGTVSAEIPVALGQ